MASIHDFKLDAAQLSRVGTELARPESVIAQPDGTLFISDARGLITRRAPNGDQALFGNPVGEPNGLAMDPQGRIVIAAMEGGKLLRIDADGANETVVLDSFEGQPLGSVNFVFCDRRGRHWVAVSTRQNHWWPAVMNPLNDGYILLIDENGDVRKVADGINFSNECRLDADEAYLYVAETMSSRVIRFPVREDGSLGEREVFGPESLGHGAYIDGIAFDAEGNLWLTTVARNGVMVISPDGEASTVFEDVNPTGLDNAVAKINDHTIMPPDLAGCAGPNAQLLTSICFAGPDLRTVYVGSLAMPHLLTFQSPTAGLPMSHWSTP
ncbi:MAG: SMP-30/gluconolactonase/LRE family protein [Myxococcota bacterium]